MTDPDASGLAGREPDLSPLPDRATFKVAAAALRRLLAGSNRPDRLTWVPPSNVITFPAQAYVFRPDSPSESEVPAQAAFDAAAGCVAVRVGAIGSAGHGDPVAPAVVVAGASVHAMAQTAGRVVWYRCSLVREERNHL